MPNDVYVGRYPYLRQVPAFRLLQAARIALSPGSIVISMIASVLFLILNRLLVGGVGFVLPMQGPAAVFERVVAEETWRSGPLLLNERSFLWPWTSVLFPAMTSLSADVSRGRLFGAALFFLFAIGLWSLVGTILSRRAAMLFTGEMESTMKNAIQYALRRWHSSAMAPLTPLFAASIAALVAATYGVIGRLPLVGALWLLLGSPFIAILAGAMAFLLLVTAIGWPLMVAAVATDDCDSFGALSRAYSGLTSKPWHALGFLAVMLLVGVVLMLVVNLFAETAFWCAMTSVAAGSGQDRAQTSLLMPLSILMHLVIQGIGGSFFWSAATISYLLLRQQVDGVPLDKVAADDECRPVRDPLPVVGIPATDARADFNGEAFSRRN